MGKILCKRFARYSAADLLVYVHEWTDSPKTERLRRLIDASVAPSRTYLNQSANSKHMIATMITMAMMTAIKTAIFVPSKTIVLWSRTTCPGTSAPYYRTDKTARFATNRYECTVTYSLSTRVNKVLPADETRNEKTENQDRIIHCAAVVPWEGALRRQPPPPPISCQILTHCFNVWTFSVGLNDDD